MNLFPIVKDFKQLDPETEKRFNKQLFDLFGIFEAFEKDRKRFNFKLSHDVETNTLHVVRCRECVSCGVEVFSKDILTREAMIEEAMKTPTVLCNTCSFTVAKLISGGPKQN